MTRRLLIAALLLLGGCEPTAYWNGIPAARRVETSERVTEVVLELRSSPGPLSSPDMAVLRSAVQTGQVGGTVSLDVLTPPGAGAAAVGTLRRAVGTLGVPADRIRHAASADLPQDSAMVRIHSIRVKTAACPGVPTSSTSDDTPLSRRKYEFGCASAANFAAMLVDPRDLAAPPSKVLINDGRASLAIDALMTKAAAPSPVLGGSGASGGGAGPGAGTASSTPLQ